MTRKDYYLIDTRLSLKAKGLIALIQTLPKEFEIDAQHLSYICADGQFAINSAFDELKLYNYMIEKDGFWEIASSPCQKS